MIKNLSLLFCLAVVQAAPVPAFFYGKRQRGDTTGVRTTDVAALSFLSPECSYEKCIGKNSTLHGSFYLNPAFSYRHSYFTGSETDFHVDPGFSFQYRYYYNFYGRSARGKQTNQNSANYIAPSFSILFSKDPVSNSDFREADRRAITTAGAVWGMQRNYRKRFSLDFNVGMGYYFAKGTTQDVNGNLVKVDHKSWEILLGLRLGFWINKRK